MKLLVPFLVFLCSAASAQSVLDQRVAQWSCSGELIQCLSALEQQQAVRFSFKQAHLEGLHTALDTQDVSLKTLLDLLCAPHGLMYEEFGEHRITIRPIPLTEATTIVGLVLNHENGEVVQDARIFVNGQETVWYTDQFGLFRLRTEVKHLELVIQKEGYQQLTASFDVGEYLYYVFKMQAMVEFQPVTIYGNDSNEMNIHSKSFVEILPNQHRIAGFGGEVDALSNMRLQGGIQNVGLGDPGLIVRGGGPDQNFILIDGIPVYNTLHILGLYSIFNSSTINGIKLYKDAFPPRYGSRLSSVVDVSLNNGNKEKLHGDADVGIVSSGIALNGPIIKDKMSFSFAARRSYADLITYPVQKFLNKNETEQHTTGLFYYDVFGKVHYQINKDHQLKLTIYNGGDQFSFDSRLNLKDAHQTEERTSGNLQWRNTLMGVQWHAVLHPSLFMTVQSAYSAFEMQFSDAYSVEQNSQFRSNEATSSSGLSEWRNTIDFDHFNGGNNHFLFGGGLVSYRFQPFAQSFLFQSDLSVVDTTVNFSQLSSTERFAYIEDNLYLKTGVVSGGMRLSQFRTGSKSYYSLQPRLFLTKNMNKRMQFRFSITDMAQFLHLLPNNNLGLPIDIWLPVTEQIEPLRSFQISTGIKRIQKQWSAGLTLFAKNYRNLVEHDRSHSFLLSGENWNQGIAIGTGTSTGLEGKFNYTGKSFRFMGSYTYCRSRRTFSGINQGSTFYSKYDRPHSLNLILEAELSASTRFTASFSFASGNPITIPTSRYVTEIGGEQVIVEEFGEVNNYRLPATHHLDLSIRHSRGYKRFNSDLTLGIYNIYNQLNPFMVFIGLDEKVKPVLKLRSYLPMMPMIKYHISF